MAFHRGPQIVRDGLVLYLDAANKKSYPGTGAIWKDLSGNGIHGTMSNTTMGSVESGSMRLDNTSDSISFGHNAILESQNLTMSAWVNLDDIAKRHILFTKWFGWSFEIHADGRPYFRTYQSQTSDIYATTSLVWGDWYYISSSFNTDTNTRKIYVNGVLENTISDTGVINYNQGAFNIPYVNNPANAKGKISTLMLHNIVIADEQILQNFNATKSRFNL